MWDAGALLRALAWAAAVEGAVVGLSWLAAEVGTGPPHSFPANPLTLLLALFHLPSLLLAFALGLGVAGTAVIQTLLMTYLLFFRYRLAQIKVRLY